MNRYLWLSCCFCVLSLICLPVIFADEPILVSQLSGSEKQVPKPTTSKSFVSKRSGNSVAKSNFPPLPSKKRPPTVEELNKFEAKLEKLKKTLPTNNYAEYYREDWKTKGDWLGRYGRQYAILCAVDAPKDRFMFYNEDELEVNPFIGPNATKDDKLRLWQHWNITSVHDSLYDPLFGGRRQAEWDDHGETYPMESDGPDLWYHLNIKNKGVYRLTMYFYNKDGHEGHNRFRDYIISIYPYSTDWGDYIFRKEHAAKSELLVSTMKTLALTRLKDFWGGTYKTFVVTGPAKYVVKIDRNYSFNTILSMVAIDRIVGEKTKFDDVPMPWVEAPYDSPRKPNMWELSNKNTEAALSLWHAILKSRDKQGSVEVANRAEMMALCAVLNNVDNYDVEPYKLKGDLLFAHYLMWQCKFWTDGLHIDFQVMMEQSWDILQKKYPDKIPSKELDRKKYRRYIQIDPPTSQFK
jgi:hypothetical protein